MEGISLISTLAIGFGVALVLGFLAEKLKVPALVGYLLAGILVSPSVFGFDVDLNLANQLAEIGIMLLMFGVGLHFSLTDLLKVKGLVVPGAICQMLLSALIGFGLSWLWGWDVGHSVLLGCCLSCASTVVVLKALEARGMLEGFDGNVAVGWLIVQDMVTVLSLSSPAANGFSVHRPGSDFFSAALAASAYNLGSGCRLYRTDAGGRAPSVAVPPLAGC